MHIGVKIKMMRISRGYNQEELAHLINKTRPLVSHIEQTGKVNKDTLNDICKALDTNREQLENISDFKGSYSTIKQREEQLMLEISQLKEKVRLLDELVRSQKDMIEVLRNKIKPSKKK